MEEDVYQISPRPKVDPATSSETEFHPAENLGNRNGEERLILQAFQPLRTQCLH